MKPYNSTATGDARKRVNRFVELLFLALLPLGSCAQTIAILNLSVAKESHRGARFLGIEASMLNGTNTAITCVFRLMWAGDSIACGHLVPFSCGQRFRCDVGSFFSFTVIGAHMA